MTRKKIMAICDTEASYACRLMEYMEEKHSLPYEIHAFTAADKLCEFAAQRNVDVLLISESAVDERVEGLPVERRVVLTDGESREGEEELYISKYQSAGSILAQVAAYSPEACCERPKAMKTADPRIYGIYAPSGGSEVTAFAAALAAILAERGETLYINLCNFSGVGQLSGEIFDHTLGDLLYYYRRSADDLRERASSVIQRVGGVYVVAPPSSPADLQEIGGAEWVELLEILLEEEDLTSCVLELSDGVRDIAEVLGLCAHIFLPTRGDPIARAALNQFTDCMRDIGQSELLARCTSVVLPVPDDIGENDLFRDAAEGVFGDCARRALTEERRGHGIVAGTAGPFDGPPGRRRRTIRRRHPRSDR